jgi:plastocyanin
VRAGAAHNGVIHGTIHEVAISGMAFVPATVSAAVGDGIRWTNADLAPHTATARDGSWTSPTLKKGDSFVLEVTQGMAGDYKCRFHPMMAGQVTISAS